MNNKINDNLYNLLEQARTNKEIRFKILQAKTATDPMLRLCQIATDLGFPLTVGEIAEQGEEYMCNLSDGRMGVTEPMEIFGDVLGQFFASIEAMNHEPVVADLKNVKEIKDMYQIP